MRRAFAASAVAALALAGHRVQAADSSTGDDLLSPDQPPIVFFWQAPNDTVRQIPQCSEFSIFTTANPSVSTQPVLPLYWTVAPENYSPRSMSLGDAQIGDRFNWTANLPVGTNILLGMTDSANHSGGIVDGYSIIPGSDSCMDESATAPATLSLNTYPQDRPCDEIVVELSGGVQPYTVSVLAAQSGAYWNLTGVDDDRVNMRNLVPAGQTYHLFVSDSNGSVSIVSSARTSQLNVAGCSEPDPPAVDSGTDVGAIAGGVVGGVVGAILIALLAWWFVRRRNQKRAERYAKQPPAATSEFRTADGRAPLVEPFRVPLGVATAAGAGAGGDSPDDSPNSESYDKSLVGYSSRSADGHYLPPHPGVLAAPAPAQHPSYASAAPSHVYTHGYDPYEAVAVGMGPSSAGTSGPHGVYDPMSTSPASAQPSPITPGGYGAAARTEELSGGSTGGGVGGSGATDGLAHPEEFEYRLPGESPTGQGALPWGAHGQGYLPPGAGRPY
ncbi:hypothetical protein Rhopal_001336-T1 [Rhodotorula paludigena]|uniref:Epidermal growth factor receptor-like transmembrane-juxtamembrane segment domain-containing protein n=1 Tax=Rhodotorula paludigena TaxID=86838 RepID=A0AAV5G7B0_9BASI|nr:hypothetical protein Rhopal_001336-T1 [Rhodotorula paludigena]